ncbi:hypothetical protein SAMN05421786_11548 [Chryseobacterium ureilyticum]|uniref:Uncharacterized protein n=1 Tax=Chryseobacterium ureilyticum TaxID=373668 RepID=A0A1N7QRZ8_9FLAO|nr:hypothetical protein [Chryseobacterium ureilyticum]SIT25653.1 hypothetical protein SAMN05421786_11548 [Chryseobacterium ureilyticum]
MSLEIGKPILENELLKIFTKESQETEKPEESRHRIAKEMAEAIYKFVKTGEVNVTVATSGTATSQTGTGTGIIK